MSNYAQWVRELEDFISRFSGHNDPAISHYHERIAAPISTEDAAELEADGSIPQCLIDFWSNGAESIECGFVIAPQRETAELFQKLFRRETRLAIGMDILSPERAAQATRSLRERAPRESDSHKDREKEHIRLWRSCIAFSSLDNGDYIGIDLDSESSDPPVAFLPHETPTSSIVCPHFSQFMNIWQQLCYLHPFYLPYFIDESTGYLNPTPIQRAMLRSILNA